MAGKNQTKITRIREEEENRLRNRIKVGDNIRVVAEESQNYKKLVEELKQDSNKKRLIIWWWAAYWVVSFLIAKNLMESWINFNSLVWSSSWAIIALLLATNNLDEKNIGYFIVWLDKEISPSKLWFFLAIKLLPFSTEFIEQVDWKEAKLSLEEKQEICLRISTKINDYKELPGLLSSNWEVSISWITKLINKEIGRNIKISKLTFNDVNRTYDKKLSAMSSVLTKRSRKKWWNLVLPKPEKIEFKWGYPVLDWILHSCWASWFVDKKKVKNLKLFTLDSMFAWWQYQNEFSKTEKYSNVLIHTDWYFWLMRLLLPWYWENNYVVSPKLFWTDCYDSSPKSIAQLTNIANELIGKNK